MSDPVQVAREKLQRLRAEVARLEDFLALYDELSQDGRPVKVDDVVVTSGKDHEGNVTLQGVSVDSSRPVDKPQRSRRADMRPAQTAELMERIIRDAGRPMTRGEIVEAFDRRDVQIPFEDKARYIGTIAWRHKGMFKNIEGRGYWLRDEPLPPDTDAFGYSLPEPGLRLRSRKDAIDAGDYDDSLLPDGV